MSYQEKYIDVYNKGIRNQAGETLRTPIDFVKVKAAGYVGVHLKACYGSPSPSQVDFSFEANYAAAKAAGLKVGAYYMTYAHDVETAIAEADFFLSVIKGKQFELPVYVDVEDDEGSLNGVSIQQLTDNVVTACEHIQAAGYYTSWYSNWNYRNNRLDVPRLAKFDSVLASYSSATPEDTDNSNCCGIWQWSDNLHIDGITYALDADVSYKDYESIIKDAGLNGWGKSEPTPIPQPAPAPAPTPVPVQEAQTYIVQSGDNMSAIATAHGMNLQTLLALNPQVKAPSYTIWPGNKITLSAGSAVSTAPQEVIYIVQPGDTLSDIAAKYGTTYQHLAAINGIANPNLISIGQKIKIR